MKRPFLYILGVPNFANYEAGTSLIKVPRNGGEIEYVSIGEDRLTRKKDTYMFPLRGIHYCLKAMGLESLQEVDYIVTDYARVPRWLNSGPGYRKLEHDYLKLKLDFPRDRILIADHHSAHAASAFYPSGFDEAAVLVVDGLGSGLNTQSLFYMNGDECREIERGFNWGIGRLYSMVTGMILPYGPEKGFGKVMGLAPYGENEQGPVLDFCSQDNGMTTDYSNFFTRFPIPRFINKNIKQCEDREQAIQPYFVRVAYDVQKECERQLVRMARYAYEKTKCKKLCIAGGVALNGAANLRIMEETQIEDVWVPPGCSDTGVYLGLALWGCFHIVRKDNTPPVTIKMDNAYTGHSYPINETKDLLHEFGIEYSDCDINEMGTLVEDGKILAWFEGGSEFGPRALGHRSIIADPRGPNMKDYLNDSIKFRESYRPYAPSILLEEMDEWLEFDRPSPFMLLLPKVREGKRDIVPAITHIDGTTRPQTVTEEENGNFYHLIKSFFDKTGVPMVLNTSFNINREPIVETPLDALICAFKTAIDFLYLDGVVINCSSYRRPEFINSLIEKREKDLEDDWKLITNKYLINYDENERDRYLDEENKIAEWHRDYKAKYELEKAMIRWREQGKRILIAGTRMHTCCLYLYIAEFPSINIVGFVPFDDYPGEQGDFNVYSEMTLDNVDWGQVDEILISTHEYQSQITEKIKPLVSIPVIEIYDDACDSLIYVLSDRWPIQNPIEAKKYGLSSMKQTALKSGGIDIDLVQPLSANLERYAVIINYHYCHPRGSNGFKGLKGIEPDNLERQIQRLSREFQFASVSDLLNPDIDISQPVAVLTFDDGLKDFYNYVFPVLKRWKVPATVYCSTAPLINASLLNMHRIHLLLGALGQKEFRRRFERLLDHYKDSCALETPSVPVFDKLYPRDDEDTRKFKKLLNFQLPHTVLSPILKSLFKQAYGSEKEIVERFYMTLDEIKEIKNEGFDIGIHTHNHHILSHLDIHQQKEEITTAVDYLREQINLETIHVAYPYGVPGTWNNSTKRLMKDLGYQAGLTLGRRIVKPKDLYDRWEIPRYDVNDIFDGENNLNAKKIEVLFSGD